MRYLEYILYHSQSVSFTLHTTYTMWSYCLYRNKTFEHKFILILKKNS